MTYQRSEVGYLEWRVVARDTGNFIVPTIDLEVGCIVCVEWVTRRKGPLIYQCIQLLSRNFVARPGEFEVQGIK